MRKYIVVIIIIANLLTACGRKKELTQAPVLKPEIKKASQIIPEKQSLMDEQYNEHIAELRNQIKNLTDEKQQINEQLNEQLINVETVTNKNAVLLKQLTSVKDDIKIANDKNVVFSEQLKKLNSQMTSLELKNQNTEAENNHLKTQLKNCEKISDENIKVNEDLKSEIKKINIQLQQGIAKKQLLEHKIPVKHFNAYIFITILAFVGELILLSPDNQYWYYN
ncbi:MAG: hypothetical protein LBN01_01960 [Endomicrobium sp.]|jgi:chromosome segregation ATPase|nr:hypothetical protein [Endomicrobium sp.]